MEVLNLSLQNRTVFINKTDSNIHNFYSYVTRTTTLVFCFIIYITGIIGNSLILWTFYRIKSLQTQQNMFVAFLAIVDLVIIGYLLPFNMYVMFVNNGIFNTVLCKFNALIIHVLFTCSVQYIMHIALSRYAKICHASRFKQIFTTKRIVLTAGSAFAVGIAFSLPIFLLKDFSMFDHTVHLCIFDRYGNPVYSLIYMVICLVIPILIITFCYLKIYCHVRKSKVKLYQHWTNPLRRRRLIQELAQTRAQFAVFVAYLVLYFPFGITVISAQFGATTDFFADEFHAVATYSCFLNSCINSLLYGFLNRSMRKAYMQSLACFWRTGRACTTTSVSLDSKSDSATTSRNETGREITDSSNKVTAETYAINDSKL